MMETKRQKKWKRKGWKQGRSFPKLVSKLVSALGHFVGIHLIGPFRKRLDENPKLVFVSNVSFPKCVYYRDGNERLFWAIFGQRHAPYQNVSVNRRCTERASTSSTGSVFLRLLATYSGAGVV